MRELHEHAAAAEWAFVIEGRTVVSVLRAKRAAPSFPSP
jgi:hypothetical protein